MKKSPFTLYLPGIVACILIMSLIGFVCADNTTIMPAPETTIPVSPTPTEPSGDPPLVNGIPAADLEPSPTIVEEVPVSPSPTPTEEIVAGILT